MGKLGMCRWNSYLFGQITQDKKVIPSRSLTARLKSYRNPIGKDRLPVPSFFRGRNVKLREGNSLSLRDSWGTTNTNPNQPLVETAGIPVLDFRLFCEKRRVTKHSRTNGEKQPEEGQRKIGKHRLVGFRRCFTVAPFEFIKGLQQQTAGSP